MTIGIGSTLLLASLWSAQPGALGCSTGEKAAAELRAAHETDRQAHLEGNAELMAPGMADEVALVSNGNVSLSRKEKMISFFKGYFARVKYLEWSDTAVPVVKISPDAQMGWMAVKVRGRYVDRSKPEAGEKTFKSSWISTYQRVGCDWKMTGNSSAVVDD
ncbi:MAG TPA: hypothetical protein VGR19_11385 [Allosphingosinicella sp.]|nr:hypothetical protein [Allosphingosinicella sp.]